MKEIADGHSIYYLLNAELLRRDNRVRQTPTSSHQLSLPTPREPRSE